jgi:hypothetical protein
MARDHTVMVVYPPEFKLSRPGARGASAKSHSYPTSVENPDNQAVETWLLRVLRGAATEYPHFHWTFFVCSAKMEVR